MKKQITFFLILVCFPFSYCISQSDIDTVYLDTSARTVPIHLNLIQLSNSTDIDLDVRFSLDHENWLIKTVRSHESILIDIGNGDPKCNCCYFIVYTAQEIKSQYKLYQRNSYQIYWNLDKLELLKIN